MATLIDISRKKSFNRDDPCVDGDSFRATIPLWHVCKFFSTLFLRKYVSDYEKLINYTPLNYRFLPYSIKWAGDDNPILINDPRFSPAGVLAPKSKADLAFIMHSLSWLSTSGTAAIVCFPGIMYRGGAEQKIRKYLIDNNFIDCIIQLPSNLFFGTSIATCIMVLKKNKTDSKVLFMDASDEFIKAGNNNKLTDENIARIVDAFTKRVDVEYFTRLVPYEEIQSQDYNLSVSTYVVQKDIREKVDINELNVRIKQIVAREQVLREEIDRIITEIE